MICLEPLAPRPLGAPLTTLGRSRRDYPFYQSSSALPSVIANEVVDGQLKEGALGLLAN